MSSDGRVGSAETGSRASTEPSSTVSAASGFDPARKDCHHCGNSGWEPDDGGENLPCRECAI